MNIKHVKFKNVLQGLIYKSCFISVGLIVILPHQPLFWADPPCYLVGNFIGKFNETRAWARAFPLPSWAKIYIALLDVDWAFCGFG